MALFLARSALCIGAVAVAASGVGVGRVGEVLQRGTRGAAESAGRACLTSAACLRATGVAGVAPLFPAVRTRALVRR